MILLRSPFAPLEISVLDPGSRPVRSRLVSTERMVRVRFPGPAAYHRPGINGNGTWHVEVSMNRDRFPAWMAGLQYRGMDTSRMEMHGTYFTFRAHALSNLRMKCRTSQSGYTPGSTLFLKVILTDRGRPLPWRSSLTAQLIGPAGEMRNLRLRHRGNGHYETSFEAVQPGIYIWKITADGKTRAGHSFRREYRLTGAVWNQVPGGLPRPQAGVPTGRPSAWLGPR